MKKIIIILSLTTMILAELINGVSVIVGKKSITMYEVDEIVKEFKFSREKAVDYLINKKIEEQKIEELGLEVSEDEIDTRVKFVAKQNKMSIDQLKEVLEARFISWKSYKKKIADGIKNEKLSQEVLTNELVTVDESDTKLYYEQNIESFTKPSKVQVIKYISSSKIELQKTIQNPMRVTKLVQMGNEEIVLDKMAPQIVQIILDTDERDFTPIIPIGKNYLSIFIEKKLDNRLRSYDDVKSKIMEELSTINRAKAVKNYFIKEKKKIKITYLR